MVTPRVSQSDVAAVSFGMREDDSLSVTSDAIDAAMRRLALVFVGFLFLTGALLLVRVTPFEWIPVLAAVAVMGAVLVLTPRIGKTIGVPLFLVTGGISLYLLGTAVLRDDPTASATRLFSLGMLAVPLIVVGATYPGLWAGLAYAVGGFVLAEGALFSAAITAERPFGLDLVAVCALVLAVAVRVLAHLVQRRAARVAGLLHDLPAALITASERQRRAGHGLLAVLRELGTAERLDEPLRTRLSEVTDPSNAPTLAGSPPTAATPAVDAETPHTLDDLEPTRQSAIRLPLMVLMGLLGAYTVVECVVHRSLAVSGVMLWAAAVTAAAAVVLLPWLTRPARGALRTAESALILALALVSAVTFMAATLSNDVRLDDNPGQYLVAVVVAVLALYRPPWPILVAGLASAVLLGAVAVAAAAASAPAMLALFSGVVVVTPLVALTVASTAFAEHIIRGGHRAGAGGHWNRTETERLTHEALAFAADLEHAAELTDDDRDYARLLGGLLSAQLGPAPGEPWLRWLMLGVDPGVEVDDADDLASDLDAEQAAALSATLSAVVSAPSVVPHSLSVTVTRIKRMRHVTLAATPRDMTTGWGGELASSALLLRAAGAGVRLRRGDKRVIAVLSFARRR